jgi:hypothetical protein
LRLVRMPQYVRAGPPVGEGCVHGMSMNGIACRPGHAGGPHMSPWRVRDEGNECSNQVQSVVEAEAEGRFGTGDLI